MSPKSDDITLTEVTKIYRLGLFKKKTAVDNLTLSIERGEVVGLLGPNGSGKSTTLKMVLGFLHPTHGEILVCGIPAATKAARSHIGYLPENPRFQRFLTATEVLYYYGSLLGLRGSELASRVTEQFQRVGLVHAAHERVQGFSKGMTQRLAIAQALLNHPSLLILDEPMSGLDPLGRMEIRQLLLRIRDEMPDITMFFSTHILSDAEQLCTSVALLKKGKLHRHGPIADILLKQGQEFEVTARHLPEWLENEWKALPGARQTPIGVAITVPNQEKLAEAVATVQQRGGEITFINLRRSTLEQSLFEVQS